MIAARRLVIIVIIDEELRLRGADVGQAAGQGAASVPVIFGALGVQLPTQLGAAVRIHLVEVAVGDDAAHVVHGGGHGGLDAGVHGRRVQRHAAPAADADDADPFRIDAVLNGQKIDGCGEILGVDVGRSHIAGFAAAFAGEGRIEGDGQKSAFGHDLGVQPAGLLLDGAEGAADGEGGKFCAAAVLGNVHVGGESDSVAVFEEHFFMLHLLAFGEDLVPFLFKLRRGGRRFRREGGPRQRHGAEGRPQ